MGKKYKINYWKQQVLYSISTKYKPRSYFSENLLKSPMRSHIRRPFRVACAKRSLLENSHILHTRTHTHNTNVHSYIYAVILCKLIQHIILKLILTDHLWWSMVINSTKHLWYLILQNYIFPHKHYACFFFTKLLTHLSDYNGTRWRWQSPYNDAFSISFKQWELV